MFKLHSFEETEKREGMSYSVSDVPWASYPSDILFVMIMCCVCEEFVAKKYRPT